MSSGQGDFHDVLRDLDGGSEPGSPAKSESDHDVENPGIVSYRTGRRMQSPEDVYIAVMGVTGAGKSTFVKICADVKGPDIVSHGQQSFTRDVGEYSFSYKESFRIHLIDTPGFDDTDRKDADVLKDIAGWLSKTYRDEIRISGILYLHRISDPRMAGTAKRNLRVFMQLCGPDCFPHVVLASTMWSGVPPSIGAAREKELIETEKFWGYMVRNGSVVQRLKGDKKSAMAVLEILLSRRKKLTLQIQDEIVNQKLQVNECLAGKQVDEDLRRLQEKHEKEMLAFREDMEKAIADKDAFAQARIESLEAETRKQIQAAVESRKGLEADFDKLQKERNEELERIRNTLNDQTREIEKTMKEKVALEERLKNGQGDPAKTQKYLEQWTVRLEKMEAELAKGHQAADKKKSGVSSDIGNMIFEAIMPWPISLGLKVGRYMEKKGQ